MMGRSPLKNLRARKANLALESLEVRQLLVAGPVVTPPIGQFAAEGKSHTFSMGSFNESRNFAGIWDVDVDWGDGSSHTTWTTGSLGSLGSRSHTYLDFGSGTYTVREAVTDRYGTTGVASFRVTMAESSPTAFINGPFYSLPNTSAFLAGSATHPSPVDAAAGYTYYWDFGDGTTASGYNLSNPPHTYSGLGTYTVSLYVVDVDKMRSPTVTSTMTITNNVPIPMLSAWQSDMLKYGQSLSNYLANSANSSNWLANVYYDAPRVFEQIAAYTGNASWNTATQNALAVYRDSYVLRINGRTPGYWVFPVGMTYDYMTNGTAASKTAVMQLSTSAAYAPDWTPLSSTVDSTLSREVAYAIMAEICAEDLGAAHRQRLDDLVNQAIGHIDQWTTGQAPYVRPFMVGLTMQALIMDYEHTGDSRVLPAVKTAADWIWNNTWLPNSQAFEYTNIDTTSVSNGGTYPDNGPSANTGGTQAAPDLNLLIAPAFAWLYNRTGKAQYLTEGDAIFGGGVKYATLTDGKHFDQNYSWSFSYVRWRQAAPGTTTFALDPGKYVPKWGWGNTGGGTGGGGGGGGGGKMVANLGNAPTNGGADPGVGTSGDNALANDFTGSDNGLNNDNGDATPYGKNATPVVTPPVAEATTNPITPYTFESLFPIVKRRVGLKLLGV